MNDSSGAEDRPNEKTGAQPGTPAAARLPGAVAGTRQARSPCVPAAERGCWGGPAPRGLGLRSLPSGKWRQRGKPPYFPASQLTGYERFQFRPVSAQLRPICGAILRRPGQSRAGEPGAPLPLFAVPLAESAQPCPRPGPRPGGAGHPLSPVRAAAQRTGEVPGRSFPLHRGPPGPFPGLAL